MKKCLVTGGCGFIGSNLTRRLVSEGWSVDVVDNLSNGYLENLEGLKIRVLPNASFLRDFGCVKITLLLFTFNCMPISEATTIASSVFLRQSCEE